MPVAEWWRNPCPTCDTLTLTSHNNPGALIASILTGRFIIGGVKAIKVLAGGNAGAYAWAECTKCKGLFVACEHCGAVWKPEELPVYGDTVTCPKCGLKLV